MKEISQIAALLREQLPEIPLNVTAVKGPFATGINLWRIDHADIPSPTHPYTGTLVLVMYSPHDDSDVHTKQMEQVAKVLLDTYPDRYRPWAFPGILIEDPTTLYSRWRKVENAKRADLGWRPLHEIGH